MNDTIVIYKSKYGATKKYANWIKEELNADIAELEDAEKLNLTSYSTIIYGGGIYAGAISGIKFIIKNFEYFENKNIVVFTVGLLNPDNKKSFEPILKKIFDEKMQAKIKIYNLRGSIDYKNISTIHKLMMAGVVKFMKKTPVEKRDKDVNIIIDTYGKSVDFTSKNSINQIINCCKNL